MILQCPAGWQRGQWLTSILAHQKYQDNIQNPVSFHGRFCPIHEKESQVAQAGLELARKSRMMQNYASSASTSWVLGYRDAPSHPPQRVDICSSKTYPFCDGKGHAGNAGKRKLENAWNLTRKCGSEPTPTRDFPHNFSWDSSKPECLHSCKGMGGFS